MPWTASGALRAISSASARAAPSAPSAGTSRLTSPQACAVWASTGRPRKKSSRVRAPPTSCRKRRSPPSG